MKLVNLWKMTKGETIEDFYKRKFDWMPVNIRNEIGHLNVFNCSLLNFVYRPCEHGCLKRCNIYIIREVDLWFEQRS